MKTFFLLLFTFLLISCSSPVSDLPSTSLISPTGQEIQSLEPTIIPEAVATLLAMSPSLEVTFDGKTCTIIKTDDLEIGEHLLVLSNLSGYTSSMRVGKLYPEKTWEDVLNWFEEECGIPGSSCRVNKTKEMNWVNWFKEIRNVNDGQNNIYYLFDFGLEGEYITWVNISWGGEGDWPCGPFHIVSGP